MVLDLLGVDVAQPDDRADRDDARVDVGGVDRAGVREPLFQLRDLVLEHRLLVLRVVVLGVLGDVAELARGRDPLGDLAPPLGAQVSSSCLRESYPSGVRITSFRSLRCGRQNVERGAIRATRTRILATRPIPGNPGRGERRRRRLPFPRRWSTSRDWSIGPVEIPTRLVLAPMAGVSVQAFRRQGRRFGAGLVCSEMVSCAGIEHRNERTLGYLRVASDEHPLAIQLFGSDPETMREAAHGRGCGRRPRRPQLRLPVKGDEDGRRRVLLDDPDRAARSCRRSPRPSTSR